MSFRKLRPSDETTAHYRMKQFRTTAGIHAFDTQARTLEQACDIIAAKQRAKNLSKTKLEKPLSLKQQFGGAKGRAVLLKIQGKISLAPAQGITHSKNTTHWAKIGKLDKTPTLHRLTKAQKREKAREMYATGQWGTGDHARRQLTKAFGVTFFDMCVWLRDVEAPL